MVRNVNPKHMNKLEKDIEREKKNIFYCMHPAVNVEKERLLYEQMDKDLGLWDILPSKIDLWLFDEILILRYLSLFQKLKDETSKKIRETNGSQ